MESEMNRWIWASSQLCGHCLTLLWQSQKVELSIYRGSMSQKGRHTVTKPEFVGGTWDPPEESSECSWGKGYLGVPPG